MEKYRCRCQYVYDPELGDPSQDIPPGTPFEDLPDSWICPLCGAKKAFFLKMEGMPTSEKGYPSIKVKVKCFSTMVKADTCDYKGSTEYEMPEGAAVHDLIEKLSLPLEAVKIIFVNHREAETDTVLKDGDQVAFSPVTGAM